MKACGTCKFWNGNNPERAIGLDRHSIEQHLCKHPELTRDDLPLSQNGFVVVADGRFACLYTGRDFGCVRHESVGR